MNKPMYETLEDARKGKVVGSKAAAKLSVNKRKPAPISDEAIAAARKRLQFFLSEMRESGALDKMK